MFPYPRRLEIVEWNWNRLALSQRGNMRLASFSQRGRTDSVIAETVDLYTYFRVGGLESQPIPTYISYRNVGLLLDWQPFVRVRPFSNR